MTSVPKPPELGVGGLPKVRPNIGPRGSDSDDTKMLCSGSGAGAGADRLGPSRRRRRTRQRSARDRTDQRGTHAVSSNIGARGRNADHRRTPSLEGPCSDGCRTSLALDFWPSSALQPAAGELLDVSAAPQSGWMAGSLAGAPKSSSRFVRNSARRTPSYQRRPRRHVHKWTVVPRRTSTGGWNLADHSAQMNPHRRDVFPLARCTRRSATLVNRGRAGARGAWGAAPPGRPARCA